MSRNKADGIDNLDSSPTSVDTDWFAKLRSQSIDPELDKEFCLWLAENPKHESEYERCELISELSNELQDDPEIADYIADCNNLIAKQRKKSQSIFNKWSIPIALAASVLVFALTMVLLLQIPSEEHYITAVGEQRLVKLADGSNVVLNTDTELSVRYTDQQRSINLFRGEALFTVAKEPDRPFTVHAANGIAKAVGTRFNVLLKDSVITVSVLEGLVDVSPESNIEHQTGETRIRLTEGQAVNYYDGVLTQTGNADLTRIEAWRAGKLDFDSARLIDVITEHNRYTKTKIIIADESIKNLLVSGVFRVGENEPLLFALENSFNVRAVDRGKVVMLLAGSQLKTDELLDPQ